MLTPSQEFEQLLDRYRFTEGLCSPEPGAALEEMATGRGRELPPAGRGAPPAPLMMRFCNAMYRYGHRR
jgi:hypothetical protein